MTFLLAALAWLPTIGAGPTGEFLLRSDGRIVYVLLGQTFAIAGNCLVIVGPLDVVSVVPASPCQAKGVRRGAWMALSISFEKTWAGVKNVYLLESPPNHWYRAGTWTVDADPIPWVPPVEIAAGGSGPPGKDGPPGPPGKDGEDGADGADGKLVAYTAQRLARRDNGQYQGGWSLLFRNGAYQTKDVDYTESNWLIAPAVPWPATDIVTGISFNPAIQLALPFRFATAQ